MDDNIGVSGALRIKEMERIKKEIIMSYAHLEPNNGRSNGGMFPKFYLVIHDIHMHVITKLQLHPTVEVGYMGLRS